MASFGKIGFLLQITRSHGIVRRYFVVNGFDGALTMLGILSGFHVSEARDLRLVLGACLGAAIALGMSGLSSAYISERAADIYDIERRLLRLLLGHQREDVNHLRKEVAIVTRELSPTQTAGFDRQFIRGIATDAGGRTSHSAIVARSLGIPAVVALEDFTECVRPGDTVIVDGNQGLVIVDPPSRQPGSFVAEKDYPRLVSRLPSLCEEGADLLLPDLQVALGYAGVRAEHKQHRLRRRQHAQGQLRLAAQGIESRGVEDGQALAQQRMRKTDHRMPPFGDFHGGGGRRVG